MPDTGLNQKNPVEKQHEPLLPEELGIKEGIREKVDSTLTQGIIWEVIDQLLEENNGQEADAFLMKLKQIDRDAPDAEKTVKLMEILSEYSEHTVRHSRFMKKIIEKLGMVKDEEGFEVLRGLDTKQLGIVAERHDIGKLSMPDRLLNNSKGEYDKEAVRIKENHPTVGHLILRVLDFDRESQRLALTHHLKYKTEADGKVVLDGYPIDTFLEYCEGKGLEPELTTEDQIAAFTDVFSALMDTTRPNDRFGTHEAEITVIERCKKAFGVMDSKIFNDPYYSEGEGAELYSAFKAAMLKIAENPHNLSVAA